MAYSRLRNAITREKLRLFVRFATYKQESSDKYPFLVKVRSLGSLHLHPAEYAEQRTPADKSRVFVRHPLQCLVL